MTFAHTTATAIATATVLQWLGDVVVRESDL